MTSLTTQVRTANATNRLNDLQTQLEKQYVLMQWLSGVDTKGKIAASGAGTYRDDALYLVLEPGNWKATNSDAKLIEKQIAVYEYDKKEASISSRPDIMGSASGGVRNGIQPDIDQFRLNGMVGVGIAIPILSSDRPQTAPKIDPGTDRVRQKIYANPGVEYPEGPGHCTAGLQGHSGKVKQYKSIGNTGRTCL